MTFSFEHLLPPTRGLLPLIYITFSRSKSRRTISSKFHVTVISSSFAHIRVGIPRIGRFTISGERKYFPRSNPRDVPECRKWSNWADSRWPRLSCSGNQTITKRSHLFRRIMCETGSSCFSSVEFSHERATIEGADLSLLHRHPWSIPSFQLILFFPPLQTSLSVYMR